MAKLYFVFIPVTKNSQQMCGLSLYLACQFVKVLPNYFTKPFIVNSFISSCESEIV